MLKKMYGRKVGMTTIVDGAGRMVGATVVEIFPLTVLRHKTKSSDGYDAVVVGYSDTKEKVLTKPQLGLFKKLSMTPKRFVGEAPAENAEQFKVGQQVLVDNLEKIKVVDVTGNSKGRGFAGTIKRHHFQRGRETHGNKNHREPGSVGQHTFPAKVFKGKRMSGRMGGGPCTVKNIKVLSVMKDRNIMVLQGGLPGANRSILSILAVA